MAAKKTTAKKTTAKKTTAKKTTAKKTTANKGNIPRKVFYELLAQSSEKTNTVAPGNKLVVIVDTEKLHQASSDEGYTTKRQSLEQRVYKMNKVSGIQVEFRIKSEANEDNVGLDYLYTQLGLFQDGEETG